MAGFLKVKINTLINGWSPEDLIFFICSQMHSPCLGDKVNYDNPMPESTLSPRQGL
jgi:hypothetical protein